MRHREPWPSRPARPVSVVETNSRVSWFDNAGSVRTYLGSSLRKIWEYRSESHSDNCSEIEPALVREENWILESKTANLVDSHSMIADEAEESNQPNSWSEVSRTYPKAIVATFWEHKNKRVFRTTVNDELTNTIHSSFPFCRQRIIHKPSFLIQISFCVLQSSISKKFLQYFPSSSLRQSDTHRWNGAALIPLPLSQPANSSHVFLARQ